MQYWLVKTEPDTYSFDQLLKDGSTIWDGVRNYTARNNLSAMKKEDVVLVYHSVSEKAVVGTAKVIEESFPDPTIEGNRWVAVRLAPLEKCTVPVTLHAIKQESLLLDTYLVRQGRLSVMPLTKSQFDRIVQMGEL